MCGRTAFLLLSTNSRLRPENSLRQAQASDSSHHFAPSCAGAADRRLAASMVRHPGGNYRVRSQG
jgi:hypothetical protein